MECGGGWFGLKRVEDWFVCDDEKKKQRDKGGGSSYTCIFVHVRVVGIPQ